MFISKKHLNRRQLLRGAGVALSLPLLDAMLPALTAQRSSLLTVSKVLGAHRSVRAGFFKFLTPEWV